MSMQYPWKDVETTYKFLNHRYLSIQRERANMHCKGTACTTSFDMGLTSAEGQKLECFKLMTNYNFISSMKFL